MTGATTKKYKDIRERLKPLGMYDLYIIAWSGKSTFNKLTKWFTRGEFSHISVLAVEMLPNGLYADSVMHFESTSRGVTKSRVSNTLKREQYGVVYRVKGIENVSHSYEWLLQQVDKKYDYRQLVFDFAITQWTRMFGERAWQGFLGSKLRKVYEIVADDKFICSEIASRAIIEGGGRMNTTYHDTPAGFIDPNTIIKRFNHEEVFRFEK